MKIPEHMQRLDRNEVPYSGIERGCVSAGALHRGTLFLVSHQGPAAPRNHHCHLLDPQQCPPREGCRRTMEARWAPESACDFAAAANPTTKQLLIVMLGTSRQPGYIWSAACQACEQTCSSGETRCRANGLTWSFK